MPDPQLDIALAQLLFLQTLRLQREEELTVNDENHQRQRPQRTSAPSAKPQLAMSPQQKRTNSWPHHRRFWHRSTQPATPKPQTASA
jgi:hypothetical protein